jgi:uncharacterized protein YecA (UPF0149 family)
MGLLNSIMNYFKPADEIDPAKLPGRNEPCWCGSGKKYKKCHFHEDEGKLRKQYAANCNSGA